MTFIQTYALDIVIVLLFVLSMILLYKKGKTQAIKVIILELVKKAEEEIGSGKGKEKYDTVINEVYKRLPFILRLIFTKDDIDKFIEEGVKYLKKELEVKKDEDKGENVSNT